MNNVAYTVGNIFNCIPTMMLFAHILQGLENCTLLENVNLYYNNLNTLEDLSPLKENPHITNLDLRLNPVARTEADYRLFVVNILPNLKILSEQQSCIYNLCE